MMIIMAKKLDRRLLFTLVLASALCACASRQVVSNQQSKAPTSVSPCDRKQSKAEYEDCQKQQKSLTGIILEDSNNIEDSVPNIIDPVVNDSGKSI